jgi:hypothetical protein
MATMLGVQERQARNVAEGLGGRRIGRVLVLEREIVRLEAIRRQQRRRPRRWLTVTVIVIVNLWLRTGASVSPLATSWMG